MAADINDKARKSYSFLQKTLNGAIDDNDTTIALNNGTNIPTDTAVTCVIDRVDSAGNKTPSAREIVTGVISGANLTNVVRGVDGTTAQSHNSGAVVEFVLAGDMWNDLIDLILTEHNQSGGHKDMSVSGNIDVNDSSTAIRDSSDNELVKFSKTASAVNELTVKNAATANAPQLQATGGDTNIDLSLVPKGTGEVLTGGSYARLGAVQNYTASATWTKPANLKFVIVEVQAGGGAGGGAANTTGAAVGGGGGAGGYSQKKIAAASLGSTETVTVGAGGTPGSAGNNPGGDGGNSSFGAHATANGGVGGTGMQSETGNRVTTGGTGGSAASGDINVTGQNGETGRVHGGWPWDAQGGDSVLGLGGKWRTGGSAAGAAATGYGAGGGGGVDFSVNTARAGGAGGAGIVRVYEYY